MLHVEPSGLDPPTEFAPAPPNHDRRCIDAIHRPGIHVIQHPANQIPASKSNVQHPLGRLQA